MIVRKISILLFLILSISWKAAEDNKVKLELVFCIDMSGSTNGIVDEVRGDLWHVINDLHYANNLSDLKIGVVAYARPSFGKDAAYVKILSDITGDYDLISHQFFQLRPNIEAGDSYVGTALYVASLGLHWSKDRDVKKVIYLIGNGSVKQGRFDYRKACELAQTNNITIHTVYCQRKVNNPNDEVGWEDIASITGGNLYYLTVKQKMALNHFSEGAKKLIALNKELYNTYVYYNPTGVDHFKMMVEADSNSLKLSEQNYFERCNYKTWSDYKTTCSSWDLVTAIKINQPDFQNLDLHFVPGDLQKLSANQLRETVLSKIDKRETLVGKMELLLKDMKKDTISNSPMDSIFNRAVKKS